MAKHTPVGIILILILTAIGFPSYLLVLKNPLTQLGPFLITGIGAILINFIYLAIAIAIFYSLIKRLKWGRLLTIYWYIASLIIVTLNIVSLLIDKTILNAVYQQSITPEMAAIIDPAMYMSFMFAIAIIGQIVSLIISVVIILYMRKQKRYFIH